MMEFLVFMVSQLCSIFLSKPAGRQRSMREYTSMMTVILEIAYDDQEQPVDEELVSKSKTY